MHARSYWLISGWLVTSLSGCSLLQTVDEKIEDQHSQAYELQAEMLTNAGHGAVLRRESPRIAGQRIQVQHEETLPTYLQQPVFYSTSGQPLKRIVSNISEMTGVPMRVIEIAETQNRSGNDNLQWLSQNMLDVAWSGPLNELLDQLARDSQLYWRLSPETGSVEFYRYETRHFSVNLPMGSRSVSGAINSSGSGAQQSSSGTSSSGTGSIGVQMADLTINPYAAITRTISSMLLESDNNVALLGSVESGSGTGRGVAESLQSQTLGSGSDFRSGSNFDQDSRSGSSRVVVAPELATVTVTAEPPVLARVADYIKRVNDQFSRNLTIDVRIYDVTLDDAAGVGFSLEAFYQRLGQYGLSVTGGPAVPFGRGPAGQVTFEVTDPNSRFSGSSMLAQALESFGAVSIATSGQVLAVNGQPAPFQVADEISFLERTSVRSGTSVEVIDGVPVVQPLTVELIPGSVIVGLTANFLPQILDDNRILLQYQLTVSELRSLVTVTSGDASIQTPNVFTQSLQQQAILRDGQSIVLFGYAQDRGQSDALNSLGGFNRVASDKRTLRVIQLQVFGGGHNA